MPRIAIVTDSSSGLSVELIARHDVRVLPYYIVAGGRMLRDGIQISRDEVFRLLRDGRHLPNTKAPTQADFAALFRSLLGKVDAALVILPSRERTAAYQHAESARSHLPELPIALLDSRHISAGQALVVLAAARARDTGGDLPGLIAAAQSASERMEFWIVLESLKYAARSGRIPNITQYTGSEVPVMRHTHGAPHIAFTAPSPDRALEQLKAELAGRVPTSGDASQHVHVAIAHAGDQAQADAIRIWAEATWSPVELHVLDLPPILAVYSGPGAIGVAVYSE